MCHSFILICKLNWWIFIVLHYKSHISRHNQPAGSEDAQAQLQTQSSFREACCSAGVPRTGTVKKAPHPGGDIMIWPIWPKNHEIASCSYFFSPESWDFGICPKRLTITHLVMWSRCLSLRCIARAGSNQAADDEEDLHPHLCTYLTWHVKPQPYTRIPVYSIHVYNIQGMCKNVWRRETTSKWVSPCFPAREDSGMPRDLTWGYLRKKNTMWETKNKPSSKSQFLWAVTIRSHGRLPWQPGLHRSHCRRIGPCSVERWVRSTWQNSHEIDWPMDIVGFVGNPMGFYMFFGSRSCMPFQESSMRRPKTAACDRRRQFAPVEPVAGWSTPPKTGLKKEHGAHCS